MSCIRRVPVTVALLVALALSCNIFAPADREASAERAGADALILEGKILMNQGKWTDAYRLFNRALAEDSGKSEAWFYKGKCILRMAQVDLNEIWDDVNPPPGMERRVPFYFDPRPRGYTEMTVDRLGRQVMLVDSVFFERKRVYDAVVQAIICLEKIHTSYECRDSCGNLPAGDPDGTCRTSCAPMDGVILREQYEADYLVEALARTALSFMDLNSNGILDYDPVNRTEEQKVYKIICEDLPSLDSMRLDSLQRLTATPDDINPKLDSLIASLEKAHVSESLFYADLKKGAERSDNIDTTMASGVREMIGTLREILPFYYYNDHQDNDGDYWDTDNNGRVDRMIWIDWDGDGRVDAFPPESTEMHIGDEAHRAAFSKDYVPIDLPGADYRRYRYRGGYTYEFIFGDWGVDEEIMDGIDNDQDGLVDEDTRIVADTLDNDGSPPSSGTLPLVWEDRNGDFLLDDDEYIQGDRSIDEEMFDGLDNDRDGRIDEDVGKIKPNPSLRGALIEQLRARQQAGGGP